MVPPLEEVQTGLSTILEDPTPADALEEEAKEAARFDDNSVPTLQVPTPQSSVGPSAANPLATLLAVDESIFVKPTAKVRSAPPPLP